MAENIMRYVGNEHKFKATISKNGDFSLIGKTVKMSFQVGTKTVHTLAGTITDAAAGKVEFTPTTVSVADEGVGSYEIKVNDGTVDVTYAFENIEFIKGVTI